jgi:hypothetical protein
MTEVYCADGFSVQIADEPQNGWIRTHWYNKTGTLTEICDYELETDIDADINKHGGEASARC